MAARTRKVRARNSRIPEIIDIKRYSTTIGVQNGHWKTRRAKQDKQSFPPVASVIQTRRS